MAPSGLLGVISRHLPSAASCTAAQYGREEALAVVRNSLHDFWDASVDSAVRCNAKPYTPIPKPVRTLEGTLYILPAHEPPSTALLEPSKKPL